MTSEYSLVGFESICVEEYLPILNNIKQDLNFILDKCSPNGKVLDLETITDSILTKRSVDCTEKGVNTISNCCQESICRSLHPESKKQMCDRIHKIILLIPKDFVDDYPGSDQNLDLVESYIKSLKEDLEESIDINAISKELEKWKQKATETKTELSNFKEEMEQELEKWKQKATESKTELNNLKEEMEQTKDQLLRGHGKIDNLKIQHNGDIEEIKTRDDKIENLNGKIKSLKEELSLKKDENKNLESQIEKLEKEQWTFKTGHECGKSVSELERIIEEKTKLIYELESSVYNMESLYIENREGKDKISELEQKIQNLETKNVLFEDESYQQLINKLKNKRDELKERDEKNQELENEIEGLNRTCRKLERDAVKANLKLKETQEELEECEVNKTLYEKKCRGMTKELRELKKNVTDDQEVANLKSEIKSLKKALADKDKDYEAKARERNNITNEKNQISEQVGKLNRELEVKKRNIDELNQDMVNLNKQITKLQEENQQQQVAIQNMKDKIKVQLDPFEIKKLEHDRNFKDMELKQFEAKYHNLHKAFEETASKCDDLNKEIMKLRIDNDNLKKMNFNKTGDGQDKSNTPRNQQNQYPNWWKNHMMK